MRMVRIIYALAASIIVLVILLGLTIPYSKPMWRTRYARLFEKASQERYISVFVGLEVPSDNPSDAELSAARLNFISQLAGLNVTINSNVYSIPFVLLK